MVGGYIKRSIFRSFMPPAVVILVTLLVVFAYFTPRWIAENVENAAVQAAEQTVVQYKYIREYYNSKWKSLGSRSR
jgi:hypothetical protein